MTKTIDDKLREVLRQNTFNLSNEEAIQAIKQAFEDEGWFKPKATDGVRYYSGQYWYDRFEEELKKVWEAVEMENGMFFALQAAQRAAELEK